MQNQIERIKLNPQPCIHAYCDKQTGEIVTALSKRDQSSKWGIGIWSIFDKVIRYFPIFLSIIAVL